MRSTTRMIDRVHDPAEISGDRPEQRPDEVAMPAETNPTASDTRAP